MGPAANCHTSQVLIKIFNPYQCGYQIFFHEQDRWGKRLEFLRFCGFCQEPEPDVTWDGQRVIEHCVVGFDPEDYCWFLRVSEWEPGFKSIIFNRDHKLKTSQFLWSSIVSGEVTLPTERYIKGLGDLIRYYEFYL